MPKDMGRNSCAYEDFHYEQEQRAACRKLWDSVLVQALKDCSGKPSFNDSLVAEMTGLPFRDVLINVSKEERSARKEVVKDALVAQALDWVNSEYVDVGSCAWICRTFGYDHERVKVVAKKINESGFKNHANKYGLHAVLWHVENAAPTHQDFGDLDIPHRRAPKLYEEELEVI